MTQYHFTRPRIYRRTLQMLLKELQYLYMYSISIHSAQLIKKLNVRAHVAYEDIYVLKTQFVKCHMAITGRPNSHPRPFLPTKGACYYRKADQ